MYGWLQAIDEALATTELGIADKSDSYDTAKRKLGELIDWHVSVALDERVNGGYRLVPVEPTPLMASVAEEHIEAGHDAATIWRAMLMYVPRRESV